MLRHAFKRSRQTLAVFLLAVAAACASAGEGLSPPRFDGLYVAEETEGAAGYTSYIRFYPDGAVVMASVSDPSTPQQVATWLSPSHEWSATGSYEVRRPRITLAVSARAPTAGAPVANSYQGFIRGDAILLDRDGGDVSVATYRFAPVDLPG